MAWLTGWGKRKKLPAVASADGALTDYQMITNVMTRSAAWVTGIPVYVGQLVQISNGKTLQCTVAGTTSATEPTAAGAESGGPTWIERPDVVYIPRASVKNAALDDLRVTAGDGTTTIPHHIPGRDSIPLVSADCFGTLQTSAWTSSGTLIGGFTDCLKLSTDGGRTWGSAVKTWTGSKIIYCVYVFICGGTEYVFAAPYNNTTPASMSADDMGLFRCTASDLETNGAGATWTRVIDLSGEGHYNSSNNADAAYQNATIWKMDQDGGGRLFAGGYGQRFAKLYRSTDNGATFTVTTDFYATVAARHIHDVKCDPWNNNNVYVTLGDLNWTAGGWNSPGVYKSTNYGDSFTLILSAIGVQLTSIVVVPECRYFASDDSTVGNIYRTIDDSTYAKLSTVAANSTYTTPKKTMWFWGVRNPNTGAVFFGSTTATTDGTMDSYVLCLQQFDSLPIVVANLGTWANISDGYQFGPTNFCNDTALVGVNVNGVLTECKKIIDQHTSTIVFKPSTIDTSDFYFYYSNTSAVNSEDSSAVYTFYDGFDGTSLDTATKWNTAPAISNGGGVGTVAFTVGAGSLLARLTNYNGSGATIQSVKITSKSALTPPFRLMSRILNWRSNSAASSDAAAATGTELGAVGTLASGFYSHEHSVRYYSAPPGTFNHIVRGSATTNAAISGRLDEPLILTTKSSASGCKMTAAAETTPQIGTQLTSYPSGNMYIGIGFSVGNTVANDTYFRADYVAALKGTANEPTYNLWAAEETAATGDPQTITFSPLTSTTYGAAPITLTATASSGLPVSYTSSNTAVATVAGSTVTVVGVGSTNITASQAGDETYAAATPVVQALTVAKADQTISISAPSYKLPTDAPFAATATASSGLTCTLSILSGPATILNGVVTLTGALGDVVIRATQAGNANYNAAADTDRTVHVVDELPIASTRKPLSMSMSLSL